MIHNVYLMTREGRLAFHRQYWSVEITTEERQELLKLTGCGELSARKMKRAFILLKADEGWKDKEIVAALNTSRPTVERIRKRYVRRNGKGTE